MKKTEISWKKLHLSPSLYTFLHIFSRSSSTDVWSYQFRTWTTFNFPCFCFRLSFQFILWLKFLYYTVLILLIEVQWGFKKLQLRPHRLWLHQTNRFWRWSVTILTKLTAVGVVISKVFEKPTETPPIAKYIFPLRLSPWQVFCITLHLTRPHICHRLVFSPNQAQIDCNRSASLIADNPSLEIHMLSHHQPPPPHKK